MKRGMAGGAHRGPIAPGRQRRTIRMMQTLLVVVGAALLLFAGYSWGRMTGFEDARRADELHTPRAPSAAQVIVPGLLGLGCLVGAISLQTGGGVRLPTPARLERMRDPREKASGSGDAPPPDGGAEEPRS